MLLLISLSRQLLPLDPLRGEGNRLAAGGDLIENFRSEESNHMIWWMRLVVVLSLAARSLKETPALMDA